MKRAKILVNKTVNGDMKYNIYRFKNEPAKTRLEDYTELEPIAIIEESINNTEYDKINNFTPAITDRGSEYEFITYSVPFEFLYKSNFVIFNIGSSKDRKPERMIEVYFNKVAISEVICKKLNGQYYDVDFKTTNQKEISDIVMVEGPSAIALNRNYTKDYRTVTLAINTRRTPYVDRESNGVYKHQYKVVERLKDYEVYPIKDTQENIYHYAVIGLSKDGKISDVSNISAIRLAENPNAVKTIIEYSDDYYRTRFGATWSKLDEIKAANAYRLKKDAIYTREVPGINVNEIKADDSNVEVFGERILKIPNIWHRDKMNLSYRHNRAYRMINQYQDESAEPSEVFQIEGYSKVNIDKIVVYKKRVTYLPEQERDKPIEIGDKDAELLRVYVRVGGIYYADAASKVDYEPIELVSDNSRLPLLQIKDYCLYSNHYNYTVYLYDEKGNKSNPYAVVM